MSGNYPSGINWRGTGRTTLTFRCPECEESTDLDIFREPWGSEFVDDPECRYCGFDLSNEEGDEYTRADYEADRADDLHDMGR